MITVETRPDIDQQLGDQVRGKRLYQYAFLLTIGALIIIGAFQFQEITAKRSVSNLYALLSHGPQTTLLPVECKWQQYALGNVLEYRIVQVSSNPLSGISRVTVFVQRQRGFDTEEATVTFLGNVTNISGSASSEFRDFSYKVDATGRIEWVERSK